MNYLAETSPYENITVNLTVSKTGLILEQGDDVIVLPLDKLEEFIKLLKDENTTK